MYKFYDRNRKNILEKLDNNSVAIIFSGVPIKKMGDENYPFTPNSNFLYLTGIDRPNEILLLTKKDDELKEVLFIEPFDEEKAKWVGAVILAEEAKCISGIGEVEYIHSFYEYIAGILFNGRIENVYIDLENRVFNLNNPELDFAKQITEKYPYINIKNLHNPLADLRRIKADCEVEKIRKAIKITGDGIVNMMKNVKTGMYEYEVEAYFDYTLKSAGVKDFAFKTIAASGKNATVLHYSDNNCKTEDNQLILLDVGAKYDYYCGDITRTFPVNGKFTKRQKQLYNIVLGGQKLVISAIKPNVPFKMLNKILIEYYEKELMEIGLITAPEQVKKYYYHGVSHSLGIETHDVGRHNEGLLQAGMVLTVEPGLYIAEEGIGIRIEDDVVVTENGCEIIYDGIPKTVEEIESVINGG